MRPSVPAVIKRQCLTLKLITLKVTAYLKVLMTTPADLQSAQD